MEISFDLLLLLTSLFALQLQTALALSNDEAPATSNASVCSDKRPCGANEFCTMQNVQFQRGYCIPCPTKENGDPNPFSCVFDVDGLLRAPLYIMNCGKSCDAHMDLVKCKFCPGDVKTERYGYVDGTMSDDDRCQLCPENDMKHPDMIMSLFGPGFSMKCAQVQAFLDQMPLNKNSLNCDIVHSSNYMCGCSGVGYVGANTKRKRVALTWLPRVMALMSLMGSSFIVYDASRSRKTRGQLLNQLLITINIFDMFGATAYSFTSLPIPQTDQIYGSRGNKNTCVAQGFFIQAGTTACFLGVSLAAYYLLTIKYGWSKVKMKNKRIVLFAPPVLVGLGFAFVGIPFYDNKVLWCNNAARWWLQVPVILSITLTTAIMGVLCSHVYRQERTTDSYSGSGTTLSRKVFKQSCCCCFLAAFFFAWVPYVALQYMWSSGKAFSNYGFILYAGSSVPLQGLLNCLVYIRTRHLKWASRGSTVLNLSRQRLRSLRSSLSRGNVTAMFKAHDRRKLSEDSTISLDISSTKSIHHASDDREGADPRCLLVASQGDIVLVIPAGGTLSHDASENADANFVPI